MRYAGGSGRLMTEYRGSESVQVFYSMFTAGSENTATLNGLSLNSIEQIHGTT